MLSWRMMRFWYSASMAAHAMLKRVSQNDEAPIVFHEYLRAGCWRHEELVGLLGSAVDFSQEATIDGPIAPQADITMGVKIVLFPASLSSLFTTLRLYPGRLGGLEHA